ncbi:MAG: SCO family protein [Actinomycetota bacterium]
MSDVRDRTGPAADAGGGTRAPASAARRRAHPVAIGVFAVFAATVVLAVALFVATSRGSGASAMPPPCRKIGCGDVSGRTAPGFRLTDQRDRAFSLGAERGKIVVLEFMDPVCTDICPIVSQEFVAADRMLGADASRVAFVGVNVNQYHESTGAVRTFSEHHGLSALPNWSFVTGRTKALQQVWHDYAVTVIPNPTGDVVHTSVLYFIDASGQMRYVAFPLRSKASIRTWARCIADVSRSLLG